MLPALLLAGGCSGISGSHSVSPLDFFMPGIGGFMYAPPPAAEPISVTTQATPIPAGMLDNQLAQVR